MNCDQITKVITDIEGLNRPLHLVFKKELPVQDGLSTMKNISEMLVHATDIDPRIKMKYAEKLFGQDFLGPDQINSAFLDQVEIPEIIPSIPFSRQELERAKELGQMLILRVNKAKDGSDLTIKRINTMLDGKIRDKDNVLYQNLIDIYKGESFYNKHTPILSWALVSKEIVPHSSNTNYLQQTEALVKYLEDEVFKGKALPTEYAEAVAEFEKEKANIAPAISSTIESEWKEAASKMEALKLTQLTRQSPTEAIYDNIVCYQQTGKRLLENIYTWTKLRRNDGSLIFVGDFSSNGVCISAREPNCSAPHLGVAFSRTQ